nr:ATP-binding protein [Streptomyces sp. SID486]
MHGRGALFDVDPAGLAPRLVGLRPHQHRAHPYEHPDEPPFVVLTGARGLGKSAVLAELRDAYRGHTPVALADCAEDQFRAPPADRPAASWSPLGQALLVIAEQLAAPVTGAGRITFPRLMTGLVAVAAGGWGDADSERIRREVERILLLNESGSWIGGLAGRWAGKVAAKVVAAATGTGPLVSGAIEATLESVAEGFTSRRHQKASVWYRTYPNAGGNAQRGLILLSQHFRDGGGSREHAERYLVRALLADLTESYAGVLPRMQRLGRPLVLLDNAQSAPGPGLVAAVLRDRTEGIADRVAFVAARRGEAREELPGAVRRGLAEVARRCDWTPDAAPSSRALLLALPPLSADDTLHIVGAVCADTVVPSRLPHAAHRLTGGNPLGIVLLAESAAQSPPGVSSLGGLLTSRLRTAEDRPAVPAHEELLARLVPAEHLEELTVLAAAHDHGSACALAAALLPDTFGPASVRALQTLLAEEGLPVVPGRFVGDPFVRTLLLLRLHLRDPDHASWRTAHETLIAHYPGAGNARYRLHHELALGRTEAAVGHLRDTFPTAAPRTWLRTLRFIASASYFHAHDPDGHDFTGRGDLRSAVALGRTDAEHPAPEGVDAVLHLRVRRLLHAVWLLADPLVLPDPQVCDRLRFELEQLSNLRPAGNALLWRASRDWPAAALAGRPMNGPGAAAGTADGPGPDDAGAADDADDTDDADAGGGPDDRSGVA